MPDSTQIEELFAEGLSRSAAQRAAWLEAACGSDTELRARVEQLLAAYLAADGILPAVPPAATSPGSESVGVTIGRYKLLEQIGEGGFGVVFMAEQEHPVRRRVALKIIKLGMDTKQVVARFEAERQALAMMEHENIARVFDAGATDIGRPYFVMELVRGVPITSYCDENKLDMPERLKLFVTVCSAVQHAHHKGIIHRDLKPNNVLVTIHDERPVPKVIDFGVAKATQSRLTEMTVLTEFRQMIGTPTYMSPEQAQMGGLDIDTRSDIYSMGVLLYELLTGTTPFDTKQLNDASFDEMQRLIRDTEPPRPSTRLGTLTADHQFATAAARGTDVPRLARSIRGELDWIVMKCLEKDRNRRYETASALCRDVERYLVDEPVQACPPSSGYRFRKFARRNKGALLAASALLAMLLVLVAGLAVSNVRVARERNEKAAALVDAKKSANRAETERQRAEQNFLKARIAIASILTKAAAGEGQWSQLPPGLRKVFSNETTLYYQSLIQQESTDPAVRFETAVAYRSLGGLHSSAGEFETAQKYYRQAIEILDALRKDAPTNFDYQNQLGYTSYAMGSMLKATTRPAEAVKAFEKAIDLYQDLVVAEPSNTEFMSRLWSSYSAMQLIHPAQRASADWRRTRERTLTAYEKLLELRPKKPDIYCEFGSIFCDVVLDFEKGSDCYRRAIELDPKHATAHQNLAAALFALNRNQEGFAAMRKALELDPKNPFPHYTLAWFLATCPDVKLRDAHEAVVLAEKAFKLNPRDQRHPIILGAAYYRAGDWNAAIAALSDNRIHMRPVGDAIDWLFMAMANWQLGKRDVALGWYTKAAESIEQKELDDAELLRLRSEAAELLGIRSGESSTAPATRP
jgi:eukaryotic-like serine/threonine-protein kinase